VSKRPRLRWAIVSTLVVCASLANAQDNKLDRQFQSAVAHYHAGQLPQAVAELEELLPQVPKSFEVHELLGLVYAAQSQNAKAVVLLLFDGILKGV
jgi:Tfp pilus assembly protein PilF